jgi:cytochrome P450
MEAIAGRFILGLENTPEYEHDESAMRLAVPRTDMSRVAGLVDQTLDEIFAQAGPAGRLDVVGGLTEQVPGRLTGQYFGAPAPDQATLIRWCRTCFRELFFNIRDDPAISGPAAAASAEMRHHVEGLIAGRQAELDAGTEGPDDILGRLLRMKSHPEMHVTDQWIRTYLIGLIVGMLPLTPKATSLAIDVLLDRPGMLAGAQAAARDGDDELVSAYLYEAMRFAPQAPGQFRLAAQDHKIAAGTMREATIPAGTRVFAATQAAMLDGRVLKRPSQFRMDRPSFHYMHFGYGLHTCFGRYIAEVQIPKMAGALLRQKNLRRAPGPEGRLQWKGPFTNSLWVEFDPA